MADVIITDPVITVMSLGHEGEAVVLSSLELATDVRTLRTAADASGLAAVSGQVLRLTFDPAGETPADIRRDVKRHHWPLPR